MSACSRCSGSGSIMSQRMVYASQGSYQTAVYDPCTKCGGSGRIKDRDTHPNSTPMSFIDSLSAIITVVVSLIICWNISETAIYSDLTLNGKFTFMVVSFILAAGVTKFRSSKTSKPSPLLTQPVLTSFPSANRSNLTPAV